MIGKEVREEFEGYIPAELRVPRAVTSPMPPWPILAVTSYGPRREPGQRAMLEIDGL